MLKRGALLCAKKNAPFHSFRRSHRDRGPRASESASDVQAPQTDTAAKLPATTTDTPPTEQRTVKPRRISKRIRTACAALASGEVKTVTDAATKANLSRSHLSRELGKPHIAEYLRSKACRELAMAAGRAAAVKVELLDSASDHVRNEASSFVLGLANIRPAAQAQVAVNIEIKAGYVIDLRDDALTNDQPRSHAKPLIEHGEVGHAG